MIHILAARNATDIPGPSWLILVVLALTGGASVAMFSLLVRRWTSRRQWVSLSDWARRRRLKLAKADALHALPAPLSALASLNPRVRLQLGDLKTSVVQFDLDHIGLPPADAAPSGPWNVLIRSMTSGKSSSTAALRPANLSAGSTAIDLFHLTPFHSLANDRFSVLAANARAANELFNSSARALLPPDVGILMHDGVMMLDFSSRPFDPVELDRMIAVSEQICAMC
jgi:hypothetical protein